jgi:hypothetical protein
LLPLDPDVEVLIGKVVVYWGAFEIRMDTLIAELSKGMGERLEVGWKRQQFVKRKAIFKSLIVKYAKQMFPEWENRLAQLADNAGDLHWRRNLVAHGYYEIEPIPSEIPGKSGIYRFKASGEVKGQMRTLAIDEPTLAKLWHDIAHLLGELLAFINRTGAKTSGFDMVIPDDDLLDQQGGSFRLLAVSEQIPADPDPSRK